MKKNIIALVSRDGNRISKRDSDYITKYYQHISKLFSDYTRGLLGCLSDSEAFIRGMGSTFNLHGNYHNFKFSKTPYLDDKKAIMSDWQAIGLDIKHSMKSWSQKKRLNNWKFNLMNEQDNTDKKQLRKEKTIKQESYDSKDSISPNIQEILDKVPEEEKTFVLSRLVSISMSMESHFAGPLPRSEDVHEYNKSIPNAGDRIMTIAEEQGKFRRTTQSNAVNRQLNQTGRGQIFAFIIGIAGLLVSWHLGINNHDELAGVIGTTSVLGLVGAFIYGKKKSSEERV